MGVTDSWARIEAWLATHAPAVRKSLRPPIKAGAADKLHEKLGTALPSDLAESVGLHDGQKESAEHGLLPIAADELGAMPSFRLLSLTEVGRAWAEMKELHDTGNFAGQEARPARGVRADWWNPAWVPIADNGGGDFFCLDLDPAKGGSVGQVIVYFNDMDERPKVAKSFANLLEELAKGFESGRFVLDEDNGIVEDAGEDDDD